MKSYKTAGTSLSAKQWGKNLMLLEMQEKENCIDRSKKSSECTSSGLNCNSIPTTGSKASTSPIKNQKNVNPQKNVVKYYIAQEPHTIE